MALIFTDQQIKDLTQLVINAPLTIASLTNDKANIIIQKAKYLADDDGNAVYTQNWSGIINAYHDELKYLNGIQRTSYDLNSVDPAAKLIDGNIHFITSPIWVNFQPKTHTSSTGLPPSVFVGDEQSVLTSITNAIALLKTGWADGAATTTTTAGFAGFIVEVTSAAGFTAGNRVLFISGSNYLYGTVTLVAGLDLTIFVISASAGVGGILTGASVTNFFAGFTLSQRETGLGGSPALTALMLNLKTDIDTSVASWLAALNAGLAALNANDATSTESTEISTAKNTINASDASITTWQAFPSIGVGTSRFGTNLPALETEIAARPAEMSARATQIAGRLGSINQVADGSFTGDGNYFKLFENLNARLNKGGGTRRQFYSADLGVVLFDQLIANVQAQAARDSITFTIAKLTVNANGTNQVTVDAVAGLAIGNSVKVLATTLSVISTTITSISGLVLTLAATVPSTFTLAEVSRIVKQN